MTRVYTKRQAKVDLDVLLADCEAQLANTRQVLADVDPIHVNLQRSMSIMMAYALWERLFRQGHGICLRLARERYRNAKDCPVKLAALWFRKSPDYSSLVSHITQHKIELVEGKETKGPYTTSKKLLESAEQWVASTISPAIEVDRLTVTLSNVDKKVVEFNAEILDLDGARGLQSVDLSLVGQLVRFRNYAAHGDCPTFGERQTNELLDYTLQLLRQYHALLKVWMRRFKMR